MLTLVVVALRVYLIIQPWDGSYCSVTITNGERINDDGSVTTTTTVTAIFHDGLGDVSVLQGELSNTVNIDGITIGTSVDLSVNNSDGSYVCLSISGTLDDLHKTLDASANYLALVSGGSELFKDAQEAMAAGGSISSLGEALVSFAKVFSGKYAGIALSYAALNSSGHKPTVGENADFVFSTTLSTIAMRSKNPYIGAISAVWTILEFISWKTTGETIIQRLVDYEYPDDGGAGPHMNDNSLMGY